jgi:hypothetical protein
MPTQQAYESTMRPSPCSLDELRDGDLIPMLNDLSALKPEEMEVLHADPLTRCRHSEELSFMRGCRGVPHGDVIAFCNHGLNGRFYVGQSGPDGLDEVSKAIWPTLLVSHRLVSPVDEIRPKQAIAANQGRQAPESFLAWDRVHAITLRKARHVSSATNPVARDPSLWRTAQA